MPELEKTKTFKLMLVNLLLLQLSKISVLLSASVFNFGC